MRGKRATYESDDLEDAPTGEEDLENHGEECLFACAYVCVMWRCRRDGER